MFGISHNWVGYISHLMTFVTLTFYSLLIHAAFILGYSFLSSLSHFLSNLTYLGDDKPGYAWLKPPFLEDEGHWWRFGGKFSCPLIYHTAFIAFKLPTSHPRLKPPRSSLANVYMASFVVTMDA